MTHPPTHQADHRRRTTTLPLAIALALIAGSVAPLAAQPCADCPGDLNGDGTVTIDEPVIGNFPIDSRPFRLWLGHPGIGQVFGIDETGAKPAGTNDAGTVVARWWSEDVWSAFAVESIRVDRHCPAP